MTATLRDVGVDSYGASSPTQSMAESRFDGGKFVRRVALLIAAIITACTLMTSMAAAQAVPVPDPEPQPLPAQTQATTPPPVSPPVTAPTVPVPSVPVPSAAAKNTAPPASASSQPGKGRFGLLLHDGTYLIGVFGDTKAVPFEAVFGNIEIPLTSIKMVDFSVVVNGTKTHRVQFINGDMLTGNVGHLDPMKFETSYGTLTVPVETLLRMSYSAPVAEIAQRAPIEPSGGASHQESGDTAQIPAPLPQPPGPIRPPRAVPVPDDLVE